MKTRLFITTLCTLLVWGSALAQEYPAMSAQPETLRSTDDPATSSFQVTKSPRHSCRGRPRRRD